MFVLVFNARKYKPFLSLLAVLLILSLFLPLSRNVARAVAVTASEKRVVILDPGHGGEDSGTVSQSGVYEKDLNLAVAKELGTLLEAAGVEVIYTRFDDRLLYDKNEDIRGFHKICDLKNRVRIAEEHKDAIFVSIHMNSFSQAKYSGLQVYYAENGDESAVLAGKIQTSVKTRLQPENRRETKPGRDIYILEHITIPAVLVECGFLSNPAECEKLCQKEYQKELSFAIFCGMMNITNT